MEDLSYKTILVAGLILVGLLAFLLSAERARSGFLLFIATLGLGFRTLQITRDLRIHPAEIALLLTLLIACAQSFKGSGGLDGPALPWWLWVLLPFMGLSWLMAEDNPYAWDEQLSECINIALVVPVFLTARLVLAKKEAWRSVGVTFYAVGTTIALLGILEYRVPGIKDILAGFVSAPEGMESADGFVRASFSFYGGPIAVFVCILALPFGLAIWQWWPTALARFATASAAMVQLGGLYISGYRSQWFFSGILLVLFAVKKRSFVLAAVFVVLATVISQNASKETQGRLESLGRVLEGVPDDSSGIKRFERIREAFQATFENPLGGGWASAGWVHSDFLQVSANLGLLPGLVFLLGYLHTLWQLAWRQHSMAGSDGEAILGFSLLLSFLVVGQLLAVQGVEFQMFTILPVWLVWALAQIWLWQMAPEPSQAPNRSPRLAGQLQASLPYP